MVAVFFWLLPILSGININIASGFQFSLPPRPRLQVATTTTTTTLFAGRNETNAIYYTDSTAAASIVEVLDMSALVPTSTSKSTKPEAWKMDDYQSVLTTALLVTGNTVGAGALVLPELAAKPGFATSSLLFTGAYLVNLMSGLILAEVAIKQHEQNPLEDPPSSFRDFANASLESPTAANGISAVSLFVNTCAITFSLGRAGVIFSDITQQQIDHVTLSALFGVLLVAMGATQSRVRISQISSGVVAALFGSVAGLLLPAHVQDPMGTLMAAGTSLDTTDAMLQVAPIMLTTLIFQNIVPPVTRILGYDRQKSVVALVLGSALPLALYLSWSFVVLGGGVDTSVGLDSPLMTLFSVAAVTGSAIGCTMSIAEELDAFIGSSSSEESSKDLQPGTTTTELTTTTTTPQDHDSGYGLPAFSIAVAVPLVCSLLCNEYTDALKLSGGYGIPVLYGAIPVLMLYTQRKKQQELEGSQQGDGNILPGGSASLGLVAAAFGAFFVNSVVGDFL